MHSNELASIMDARSVDVRIEQKWKMLDWELILFLSTAFELLLGGCL